MGRLLDAINRFVWGIPALILILAVGILLSVKTRWVQFRLFPTALRQFLSSLKKSEDGAGVSSYKALCTALAATVGTGNLAGVAGAIAIGGPGAVFWMWICALLGMVTKFAEATLAVHFRVKSGDEAYMGGPMYIVRQGMPKRWQPLAGIYCFFGVVAAFGVGSATQVNAVLGGINGAVTALGGRESGFVNLLIGIALAVLIVLVLYGGAKRIGTVASFLVPFASVFYLLLCFGVFLIKASSIPGAFSAIVKGAFYPRAVTGGVIGSVFVALRVGASRGVFTNEAGMGTASIAHAGAIISHPVEQGMMGIVEVFLDTILICTLTALAILCSGVPIKYGIDPGITLTMNAFVAVYGDWCVYLITALVCILAFATILGWGLYGVRCAQYLFGDHVWNIYVCMQAVIVLVGIFLTTSVVWNLAEIVNGLMAIPNLIALVILSPEFIQILKDYLFKRKAYSSN